MTAIFYDKDLRRIKTVHFGATGYEDYTTAPHDKERKARYIKRHRAAENWKDCTAAGTLSRYILWNKRDLKASIDDYYLRCNLKRL
ncbi:MAG: hypothetical protein EB084_19945 [Proteobacteria bacterium]|nr:hypothetical protein [Pseudomonadota bacterium]